jgi:hypothetical protein
LPHEVQTKSGSMSDSRTSSAQPSALIAIGNDVVLFGAVGYKLERIIGERTLQRPSFILRRVSIHCALHGASG